MTSETGTPTMERLSSALAEQYTIERLLGRGGMAAVYLARDLRHDRNVALKILRPDLAAVLGRERFLKEIGIAARLAHPNIVPVYDSGEADGTLFYVMPHLTGETLRQVIEREGQLDTDHAITIALGVAAALDYAHRQGVVHRDIKPENILLHEGQPLVLDFGIALALDQAADQRMTGTGISLGTPGYMAPEQAMGDRQLDARTDVYALGCVVYEMLVGEAPFTGGNLQVLIARVLNETPLDVAQVRPSVPAHVNTAVRRALAKVPAERFPTAGALAAALESPISGRNPSQRFTTRSVVRTGAVVAGCGMLAVAGWHFLATSDSAQLTTVVRPLTSFPGFEAGPSWAPDGSQFAYMQVQRSSSNLFVLSPGGVPRQLTDSEWDELTPRWSPDGSKIAFVADYGTGSAVYWIAPTGGTPRRISDVGIPLLERTMSGFFSLGAYPWSPDAAAIVFARMEPTGGMRLWRATVAGGELTPLTNPAAGDDDLAASWSFDGSRIVFARMRGGIGSLWTIPAAGGTATPLLRDNHTNMAPAWMPDDRHVVFMSSRGGALNLWEMNVRSGRLRRITSSPTLDYLPSVSKQTGDIAYTQFSHEVNIHELRLRPGTPADRQVTASTGDNFGARMARDGQSFVYYTNRTGNYEVWRHDLSTGSEVQLTGDPANDFVPDFSPDGRRVAFLSDRGGIYQLWIMDRDGRAARRVTDHPIPLAGGGPVDVHFGGPRWTPDGEWIGYVAPSDSALVLWMVRPDGTDLRATNLKNVFTFDWYLDSNRVVYTRTGGSGVEMRAADLETGEDVLLLSGPVGEVAVAPRGDAVAHVYSRSHFTMDLYVLGLVRPGAVDGLPRATGQPRQVTFGNGTWHAHNGGWTSDGSALLYSRDTDRGDIFAVRIER